MLKSSVIVSLLLFASSAFACPDLVGTYLCESEGEVDEISITQADDKGVTVYTVTSPDGTVETVRADGVPVIAREADQGYIFTSVTVTTCQGDILNMDINLTVEDEAGNKLANVDVNSAITKSGSDLHQTVTADGQTETYVCKGK